MRYEYRFRNIKQFGSRRIDLCMINESNQTEYKKLNFVFFLSLEKQTNKA